MGPFFQDRTGSVFSFFKGDFSLKKDTLFALPVITPACCYKSSGSILISGCIYFFFQVTTAVTARVVVIFSHIIDEKSLDSQGFETK